MRAGVTEASQASQGRRKPRSLTGLAAGARHAYAKLAAAIKFLCSASPPARTPSRAKTAPTTTSRRRQLAVLMQTPLVDPPTPTPAPPIPVAHQHLRHTALDPIAVPGLAVALVAGPLPLARNRRPWFWLAGLRPSTTWVCPAHSLATPEPLPSSDPIGTHEPAAPNFHLAAQCFLRRWTL